MFRVHASRGPCVVFSACRFSDGGSGNGARNRRDGGLSLLARDRGRNATRLRRRGCASLWIGYPRLFRAGPEPQPAGAGFIALLLLWDPHSRPLARCAAVAGLLAGYALLCDYSGIIVILVVALYVWLRAANWRALAAFVIGVIPGAAGLAIYQAWAFGSFLQPSQHYMMPTAPTSRGYRGFDWPSPSLMWANFFDPRFGLFAWCPALALAAAAPFTTRVRYRVPKRETWVLLIYFALFVLFCAANQYSWLQPLTGFRYLTPVVPGLALLAMMAAQALPQRLRLAIAFVAVAQSVIVAAAHENDIRLELAALWKRNFAFFWMIRLRQAGVPVLWVWTPAVYLVLIAVLALTAGVGRQRGQVL